MNMHHNYDRDKPAYPPGHKLAVWGVVFQALSFVGTFITLLMILPLFFSFASTPADDPVSASMRLSATFLPAALGSFLGLVGMVMMLIALFKDEYHPTWFRTVLWIFAILWLFSFPVGTVLGVMIIIQLNKLNEPRPPQESINRL